MKIIMDAIITLISAYFLMLCWNWSLPNITSASMIDYSQSLFLLIGLEIIAMNVRNKAGESLAKKFYE